VLQSSAAGLTCAGRNLAGGVGCAGRPVTCIARGDSVGAEFRISSQREPRKKDYIVQKLGLQPFVVTKAPAARGDAIRIPGVHPEWEADQSAESFFGGRMS
jgi:hypothetical protein